METGYSETGVPLALQGPAYRGQEGDLVWEPEARFAYWGERDGDWGFWDDIEEPDRRPLMVAEIGLYQFNCYAAYYAGGDWTRWNTLMLGHIAHVVYLISEQPNEIYCVSEWKGLTLLFGKLDENNVVWERCNIAFQALAESVRT